jgi:acyl-CoA synthetase (NDP forming)
MVNPSLCQPTSIAIICGSQNTAKPGVKIIENLLRRSYHGALFVVNPKSEFIHNLPYPSIGAAPIPDLAILAILARFCSQNICELRKKGRRCPLKVKAENGHNQPDMLFYFPALMQYLVKQKYT